MASPTADRGQPHQRHPLSESASEPAFLEAQKWIEAVTGRCFSAKDSRGGLENGILLCELLSSIKPGLVKKINRLPTPIAGLDNLSVFLRGCEELGLKGSQLFDPGDLQDTSTCPNANRVADCSRKLKNVLITIYWLGRAANSCTSYNGPTLDLKEFEGLLSQMRKEAEDTESPQRSIRDSGYIDCWDSERSDSLSPPRHGREDSFDSLDSFGSRSRQTPSPDVLVARSIGSDGRGSDSESDAGPHGGRKLPDVRKDDMLARRTSVSELRVMVPFNQYLPNKSNASGYVPTPLRRKRGDREGREEGSGGGGGSRKSWSTATSPIGGDIPFRFSHRAASVSDDPESVSMIDMRCEEDGILPHHSQVRHELMHNQYNMMKEEEDHWQDDLARWKSRRRSVSQDLIKKEEERKMMEKLMTGEGGAISQRRKSIKTYREIVEEKERRENDLREAYRLARTPEEAALVLHRYAQRFTISEAVLERLQLPKLLDRSVSEDPTATTNTRLTLTPTSCSPTPTSPEEDPNGPLKYLRQQSLPAPKFTATVEAQVVGFPQDPSHRPQIRSCKPEPNPSIRAVSPKSVPLLMPKPYSQPKGMQMLVGPRPGKVDDLLRVNGDMGNDEVTTPESEGRTSPLLFYPSPATPTASSDGSDTPPCEATLLPTHSPSPRASPLPAKLAVAQGGTGTAVTSSSVPGESDAQEKGNAQESTPPSRPTSLPSELQSTESLVEAGGRSAAGPLWEEPNTTETAVQPSPATESQQAPKEQTEVCMNATATRQNATVLRPVLSEHATQQAQPMTAQVSEPSLESSQRAEEVAALADPGPVRKKPPCEAPTTELANSASYPPATGNPRLGLRWEFFTPPEGAEQERGKAAVTQVSSPVVAQAKRGDRWSWDPDEERQRQERWQQEQERMLQEKYQHEQEKLKQEWERAQREVEEEERKYHEEERRILEETVAPLTPLSSTLPSPIRGDGPTPMDPQDTVVRSLADWERKQELLERQGGNTECVEWKGQDNDSSSDISTASRDENLKTAVSQNSSQADKLTPSLQNGQRAPPAMAVPQPHNKKQYTEVLLDYTKPSKQAPSRDRRCGSIESMGPSPLKSPTTCPSDMPQSPNRSVSGKKLCSSCGHPLGKGAAMIIETLSLYFHIQCFKCGVCKGQLGDTTMGTDVRIRNGLLNCHQCYIRSRSAGQPTTL
ncbi:LIM and calponin homology domains-containing protein 1-like isoform X4 [Coregonus clupeaformis]|uniref:LIM and calponin homology domains-containing protein 1-like isoform X4 n=1 Tax=Coregonus clupeaformis TaxID=59861 RepID=UPI001E1C555B|nr:LIM and calponin homology domains-containing protein 1-like isoform X4 [Coregonus clupeaformis]